VWGRPQHEAAAEKASAFCAQFGHVLQEIMDAQFMAARTRYGFVVWKTQLFRADSVRHAGDKSMASRTSLRMVARPFAFGMELMTAPRDAFQILLRLTLCGGRALPRLAAQAPIIVSCTVFRLLLPRTLSPLPCPLPLHSTPR